MPNLVHLGSFPGSRLRRLRSTPWIRDLVAQTTLSVSDLILPVFIRDENTSPDIGTMPGVKRRSLKDLPVLLDQVMACGIQAIALFPVIPQGLKCPKAAEALNPKGLLLQAIKVCASHAPGVGIISDAALDAFTSHGHDGLLGPDGDVDNDATLQCLADHAVLQAKAGAHVIAPSDMMDGRVKAIRQALDDHGFQKVAILSYAAKYASAFYGPFREALQSAACLGTGQKFTYHMDPRNSDEALREAAQDIQEHADMIMVKPGLMYLDILWRLSTTFSVPTFAFHVSGEYAMMKAAAEKGWIDYDRALIESLIAFKRAGASGILTYGALDAASLLKENSYGI